MAKTRTIVEDDLQFIQTVIGPQLQKPKTVEIRPSKNHRLLINYCSLKPVLNISGKIILLLTGFGSGWTGIAKLGYDFVKLGYKVFMLSLPGYGNSSDPLSANYDQIYFYGFDWEAHILKCFIDKVLPGKRIHLVGHSMSGAIITFLPAYSPNLISSLTLLNPAGFERRGMIYLAAKFGLNGILHSFAFRDNPIWAELKKFLPKENGAFSNWSRLRKRHNEGRIICDGGIIPCLENTLRLGVPVACVWGTKDFVFPMRNSSIAKLSHGEYPSLEKIELPLWHNTTMLGSEIVAEKIDMFISSLKQ
ncbi:MAG: alpha/beta fold hydrolase [Candidatus Moraniibacteriota bacterium]